MDSKQLTNDITELARAYYLFSNCHNKLYSFLVIPENNEGVAVDILGTWDDTSGMDKYLLELNQIIYAAATSMTALIAVSKILEKGYKNESFYQKYEKSNKAIINNASFIFWRRLRNYIMHNSEAPVSFKVQDHHYLKLKAYLDSNKLLDHDWRIGNNLDSPKDVKTIEYLMWYKDGIYLANIIANYKETMHKLWDDVFISLAQLQTITINPNQGGRKR